MDSLSHQDRVRRVAIGVDTHKYIHVAVALDELDRGGPWRSLEQVELATSAWVHWWNTQRLHGACGDVPPAEYEAAYWPTSQATAAA